MILTIPVEEAVGTALAHDITEIRRGEFKGPAFRKGHVVRPEDIVHLKRLGKDHVYVLRIESDEMHEDEAARELAHALAGPGVVPSGEPREGKINLCAEHEGLLRVDVSSLTAFNMLGEVMCATLHTHTRVTGGQKVAGTRAIPLVVKRAVVDEAVSVCAESGGVVSVLPFKKVKASVLITGSEVYYGRIEDKFAPIMEAKIESFGSEVIHVGYAPDDRGQIAASIGALLEMGAGLILVTGGMSVDPDDVTRHAIRDAGARDMVYGSPVLPGAMCLVAYMGDVPVIGVPACGMFHTTTILDLILPRVLTGERIGRSEIAKLGHGGMCLKCEECRYPVCPFGKGS